MIGSKWLIVRLVEKERMAAPAMDVILMFVLLVERKTCGHGSGSAQSDSRLCQRRGRCLKLSIGSMGRIG